jgi:hypothetical protein
MEGYIKIIELSNNQNRMREVSEKKFSWYLDIPNRMFSLEYFPFPGKAGLPLCEEHGRQLEKKEGFFSIRQRLSWLLLTIVGCVMMRFPKISGGCIL